MIIRTGTRESKMQDGENVDVVRSPGFIGVVDGCWKQFVLVTASRG